MSAIQPRQAGNRVSEARSLPADRLGTKSSLAIVVPCYNSGPYLGAALESTRAQTCPPEEVLVVDDGSTDDTGDVCRRFPGVRYLHKPNGGAASARNLGLASTDSEHVLFLDADDLLRPEAIESLWEARRRLAPDVGVVFGHSEVINGAGETTGLRFPEPAEMRALAVAEPAEGLFVLSSRLMGRLMLNNVILQGCALISRSVFAACGVFDESLASAEDQDLWLRVAGRFRMAYLDRAVLRYRKHDGGLTAGEHWIRNRRNILRVLERASQADWAGHEVRRLARRQYGGTCYHLAGRLADRGQYGEAAAALWDGLRRRPLMPKAWARLAEFTFRRLAAGSR